MVVTTNLGFPRIGAHRELKRALERYWKGRITESELQTTARTLRKSHWQLQANLGVQHIPSNDFSLYDHVLDMSVMTGALPSRYQQLGNALSLGTYFAMARGVQDKSLGIDVAAMEMTKWFDTNYHYIVPEFHTGMDFALHSTKAVDDFLEAKALGILTRPVLLGPVSFLLLGKMAAPLDDKLNLLPKVIPVYLELIKKLKDAGAEWLQIDEPILTLKLAEQIKKAISSTYQAFGQFSSRPQLLVATYFGGLKDNLSPALALPVDALHLDLVRAPEMLEVALEHIPEKMSLSLGLVDGRNIWRSDLDRALHLLKGAVSRIGAERVMIGPSCSLMHVPMDLDLEKNLDEDLLLWLSFAKQKLIEIRALADAAMNRRQTSETLFEENRQAIAKRRDSPRINNPKVKARLKALDAAMSVRKSPYAVRCKKQNELLKLPPLPTTTIGSFPQTAEIRQARKDFKKGTLDQKGYRNFLSKTIERTIRFQEEAEIDVLVHGEYERNDMVEYFAEQMNGYAFTDHGWVQSFGSRYVKPPIIYGDVTRPEPMTVEWTTFAQSLSKKPVKGILTGPVTMLKWAFVRDDQPLERTCQQVALAIRDEVADLERAGIRIIQIDEPAIREGMPLHRTEWGKYLSWAVEAFRLASSGVENETQIHTHMCYSEFNDIFEAIVAMDADVLSIEASRSKMDLLDAFAKHEYPNAIGPGLYDIHSPRIPEKKEIEELLKKALLVLKPEQLWVNPDCGLKTRQWKEVEPALKMMVQAAMSVRNTLSQRPQR